jgi:hypothetical protein
VLLRKQQFWFACFVLTAHADVDLHLVVNVSIGVAVRFYVVAAKSERECRCHGFAGQPELDHVAVNRFDANHAVALRSFGLDRSLK